MKKNIIDTETKDDVVSDIVIVSNSKDYKQEMVSSGATETSLIHDYLHDILLELREQSMKIQTMKKCLLFFVILTIISIVSSIIGYINIVNTFKSIFSRFRL